MKEAFLIGQDFINAVQSAQHLVIGLGASGQSIVRALNQIGVTDINAFDTRENHIAPDWLQEIASVCYGQWPAEWLASCEYLWISPGISLQTEALQTCLQRLPAACIGGDIELFARLTQKPVIAITGTNGKSTVTSLVGHLVQQAGIKMPVGGNLGQPALDLWNDTENQGEEVAGYILELSSFQLETTTSLNVSVGAILNIEPDHLDRYRDFEEYTAAKLKLLPQAKSWVLNLDDQYLIKTVDHWISQHSEESFKPYYTFSTTQSSADCYISDIQDEKQGSVREYCCAEHFKLPMDLSPLSGLHNDANVLAVFTIMHAAGLDLNTVSTALPTFQGLAHRCVKVLTDSKGVIWYNDSKATNIPATLAAIKGFTAPKWLILGGVGKEQDFSLLSILTQYAIQGIVLIGKDAALIAQSLPDTILTYQAGDLLHAIEYLNTQVCTGDIVLFSPACASFDQFKSFEHRGECFMNWVQQIVTKA